MDMIKSDAGFGKSDADQMSKMANQDAFEESSGPIIYMTDNRMPAIVEFKSTIIYIIYLTLILVLLLILPGVRKTKFKSSFCLITLLTVGASILLAMNGSHWLTGYVNIQHLRYSSKFDETLTSGRLEVNIGLNSVNVSLSGMLDSRSNSINRNPERNNNNNYNYKEEKEEFMKNQVMYNERFSWSDPEAMIREHEDALKRGLPYPILTITEYLSHDSDGFNWSRRLREAGHFTSIILCAALISWLLTIISMCALPNLMAALMLITGILMMASVGIYTLLIFSMDSLSIRLIGGQVIEFEWGLNYIITHIVGLITIIAALMLFVLQEHSNPGEQFTIMESERNVIDRKATTLMNNYHGGFMSISGKQMAATIESKPLTIIKQVPINQSVMLNNNYLGSNEQQQGNISYNTSSRGSVIIPISDIERNFGPSTN